MVSTNGINLDIERSVTSIPNTNLQTCQQLFSSENCLSRNSEHLHESFSHSISLPTIVASSIDPVSVETTANKFESNAQVNVITACIGEEDMKKRSDVQFQDKKIIEIHQDNSSGHKHDKMDIADSRLQTDNNENSNVKNQDEENPSKENGSIPKSSRQIQNNPRATLVDDSKLVKMSLLTNPMNIMQSNVQLINKSRNFLNFITEKSTNIMEKALLPQHLAMKYNHASKSIEADAKFYNEAVARDVISKSIINVANSNNLNVKSYSIKQICDVSDNVINNDIKTHETCTDLILGEEQSIRNSSLKNDERKYIPEISNISRLDRDIIPTQMKYDISLVETSEDRHTCSQTEKSYDDKYKEDSEEKLNRSNKSIQESQTDRDAFILQVENLEKTINKLSADLNAALDMQNVLKKECLVVNKEKENMVMKYVISEKQLIDSQRYTKNYI